MVQYPFEETWFAIEAAVDRRPALIYARESRDDYGAHYERIETQRDILLEFCRARGLVNLVDVILDDDSSGTCFRRLDSVLERVRRGEVQVLVFKDSSRLGRNLRESLNFLHAVETCGGEVLFESEGYDEDLFPLLAWFHERRAKDDSLKIRRVLRHKMENGTLLVRPVYGYRKGEGNRLEVNPETAPVVREIYSLFLGGMGAQAIAGELNRRGLPTPSRCAGLVNARDCWTRQHIARILSSDVYTGTQTCGKRTNVSYKDKRVVNRPSEEWVVLDNHHEAIVSPEVFATAQAMQKRSRRVRYMRQNRPFSGLLVCGRCGRGLVLRKRKGRRDAYICGKNHDEGAVKDHIRPNYGCTPHHIKEETLYAVARNYLHGLLSEVDLERVRARLASERAEPPQTAALRTRMESARRALSRMYDDRLSGLIDETLFAEKQAEYRAVAERCALQLEGLQPPPVYTGELTREILTGRLAARHITSAWMKLLFARAIYYLPGELPPEARTEYGLSGAEFTQLQDEGGLVLLEAEGAVPF